ncbi:MAG TPA: response regulator [Polyangiaceae bacterium]|jgi:DNA-binding NarL/FixJ family response regulator|nr:response regulator [Polyangiaceae bacterium]
MSRTVLLVEDENDTRDLLARALERAGYRALTAANGADALRVARAEDGIDVVVTDIVMDGDDRRGLRLMTELRAAGVTAPTVVITAYADVDKVKTALNDGAAHLLEKPFGAAELVAAIERVLDGGGARRHIEDIFERSRLTEKERTVARHLLRGLSSSEIATLESNSPKTIRQHVSQIYAKCGVGTRAEFFRLAYER